MSVNKIKINVSSLTTGATITVPVSLDYQFIDQAELINRVFVEVETEKNINPIIDYEKARYLPVDYNNKLIDKIIYNVNFIVGNTYAQIGFDYNDIKLRKEVFNKTFLDLNFYDSDNPLNQNLITNVTLYPKILDTDLQPDGQPKQPSQIPVKFVLENPILNPRGFSEGYHLYDYKDELLINGLPKYLYMRASFKNAKTGSITNMMVKNTAQPIDLLVRELYTRYVLFRLPSGYYYRLDDSYQGNLLPSPNNVLYSPSSLYNNVTINLYQILAA